MTGIRDTEKNMGESLRGNRTALGLNLDCETSD